MAAESFRFNYDRIVFTWPAQKKIYVICSIAICVLLTTLLSPVAVYAHDGCRSRYNFIYLTFVRIFSVRVPPRGFVR